MGWLYLKEIREGNTIYQTDSFKTALDGAVSPLRNYISVQIGIPYITKVYKTKKNT